MSLSIENNMASVVIRELAPSVVRDVLPASKPTVTPIPEPVVRQPVPVDQEEVPIGVKTSSINPLNISARQDEPTATEADRTIRQPVVIDQDTNLYTQNGPAPRPEPPPQPSYSTSVLQRGLAA